MGLMCFGVFHIIERHLHSKYIWEFKVVQPLTTGAPGKQRTQVSLPPEFDEARVVLIWTRADVPKNVKAQLTDLDFQIGVEGVAPIDMTATEWIEDSDTNTGLGLQEGRSSAAFIEYELTKSNRNLLSALGLQIRPSMFLRKSAAITASISWVIGVPLVLIGLVWLAFALRRRKRDFPSTGGQHDEPHVPTH